MKHAFLAKLACPFDKHDLEIKIIKQEQEEILEGLLTCPECQRYYPIVHGIPIMSPDEYRQAKLEVPILNRWGEQLLVNEGEQVFRLADQKQITQHE